MNRKSTFLIYGASGEEEGFATNEFIFPIKTIGELTELERCVSQSREAYKRFVSIIFNMFPVLLLASTTNKTFAYRTNTCWKSKLQMKLA